MSLVSRSKKFIYFHFPKTGGTSFIDPLLQFIDEEDYKKFYMEHDHDDASVVKKLMGSEFWEMRKIATVRNPFAILISEYFFKRDQPEGSGQEHIELCRNLSIRDFIIKFVETDWDDDKHSGHFKIVKRGQLKYHSINNVYTPDFTIKLEEITQEKVNNAFGFEVPEIEKKNTFGDITKYRDFYDSDTRKLVEELYREDLNYFNYEF